MQKLLLQAAHRPHRPHQPMPSKPRSRQRASEHWHALQPSDSSAHDEPITMIAEPHVLCTAPHAHICTNTHAHTHNATSCIAVPVPYRSMDEMAKGSDIRLLARARSHHHGALHGRARQVGSRQGTPRPPPSHAHTNTYYSPCSLEPVQQVQGHDRQGRVSRRQALRVDDRARPVQVVPRPLLRSAAHTQGRHVARRLRCSRCR